MTRSWFWLKPRVSMATMPRSGLLADSRISRTSDSAYSESPGNMGCSKTTLSYPRLAMVLPLVSATLMPTVRLKISVSSTGRRPRGCVRA